MECRANSCYKGIQASNPRRNEDGKKNIVSHSHALQEDVIHPEASADDVNSYPNRTAELQSLISHFHDQIPCRLFDGMIWEPHQFPCPTFGFPSKLHPPLRPRLTRLKSTPLLKN